MTMTFEAVIDNGLPEIPTPDADILTAWEEWLSTRPAFVADIGRRLPPWMYYEMPKTKQIVTVEAIFEDGTIRVTVVGDQISIPAIMPFGVFGVSPDDLIECTPKVAN